MKKGQLLAALALAFALGVVAPVAGVYNSASVSAFSIEDTTATGKEVANAVAAVEADGTYNQAVALIDAYAEYTAHKEGTSDVKYAEYNATNAGKIVDAANTAGITGEIAGVAADASAGNNTIAETEAVISAIKANAKYQAVTGLNAAIESKSQATLVSAIKAYYAAYKGITASLPQDEVDFSDDTNVAKDFDSLLNAITTTAATKIPNITATGLTTFNATDTAIETAEENIAQYNAGYALLNDVLSVSGIFNATGKENYSKADTLAKLAALISDGSDYQNGNFVANLDLDNWKEVNTAVEAAGFTDDNANHANWVKLENIAKAYKEATNSTSNTTVIMAELAGYQATDPDTPAVNTIKSADGKVSVTGNIPAGVYVEVSEAKMPENFEGFGELKNAAFDIVLKNADGTVYNVDQTLVVSIAVPEGINGANSDVIYITSMGGTENMKAKYADGFMTFTTNHFSIYAIVERAAGDNGGGSNVTPGDTGTVAQAEGTASATGILAGIAAALTAAGAGVVAFRNARRNSKKNA